MLFGILIAIGVLIVGGHLSWLFFAWLFRTLFGPGSDGTSPSSGEIKSSQLTVQERRKVVKEELTHLRNREFLPMEACLAVLAAYDAEDGKVSTAPAVPPASAEPAPIPAWPAAFNESIVSEAPPIPASSEEWAVPLEPASPVIVETPPPLPPPVPVFTPPPAPVVPAVPSKPWTELLEAFMESKHIRWGELIGGMLIVLCSTALVISLWSTISEVPILKFGLFTGITAALFGAALFMEHRWKLPSTSRGLLITSTLLIPLNFLAIAAFSGAEGGAAALIGKVVAASVFSVLAWYGARVLTPAFPALMPIGVVGSSALMLFIHRGGAVNVNGPMGWLWAVLPVAAYAGASLRGILPRMKLEGIEEAGAYALLTLTGTSAFAAFLTLGFLGHQSGMMAEALRHFAPVLCVAALPALACGLLLGRKGSDAQETLRLIGNSVAAFGVVLLGMCVVCAAPMPAWLIPVLLECAAILLVVAWRFGFPLAHAGAIPALAAAVALTTNGLMGRLNWMEPNWGRVVKALTQSPNAWVWFSVALVCYGVARWFQSRDRRTDSLYYLWAAAIAAVGDLGIASWHGLGRSDDHGAFFLYALHAALAFIPAIRNRSSRWMWAALILLLVTIIQGVVYKLEAGSWGGHPWTLVAACHATLSLLIVSILSRRRGEDNKWLSPAHIFAEAGAVVFTGFLFVGVFDGNSVVLGWRFLWVSVLWLELAFLAGSAGYFTAFQAALFMAMGCALRHWLGKEMWFQESSFPLGDRRTWVAYGNAAVLFSLAFLGLRLGIRARQKSADIHPEGELARRRCALFFFLHHPFLKLDRAIAWFSLAGALALVFRIVAPGIGGEIFTGSQHLPGSIQPGLWCWLGLMAAFFAGSLWDEAKARFFLGLEVIGVLAVILVIPGLGALAPTASLCWRLAVSFAVISTILILRHWLRPPVVETWPGFTETAKVLKPQMEMLAWILCAMPVIGLTALSLLSHGTAEAGPLALLTGAVLGLGLRDRTSSGLVLAGFGLMLTITVSILSGHEIFTGERIVLLLQANAIGILAYAGLWRLGCVPFSLPEQGWRGLGRLGASLVAILGAVTAFYVFLEPRYIDHVIFKIGDVRGWVAVLLSCGVLFKKHSVRFLSLAGLLVSAFLAATTGRWDHGQWLAYHTLLVGVTATCCLPFWTREIVWKESVTEDAVTFWSLLMGAASLFLAIRCYPGDALGIWWCLGVLIVLGIQSAALAWLNRERTYTYLGAGLFELAAMLWAWRSLSGPNIPILEVALLAFGCAGLLSIPLEMLIRKKGEPRPQFFPPLIDVVVVINGVVLGVLVIHGLFLDAIGEPQGFRAAWRWAAWVVTAGAVMARFVDPRARGLGAGLYVMGAIAVGLAWDQANCAPVWLAVALTWSAGLYALIATAVWRGRGKLTWGPFVEALRLRPALPDWLWMLQSFLAIGTVVTAYGIVWSANVNILNVSASHAALWRIGVGLSLLLPAFALGGLAKDGIRGMRIAALSLGVLALIAAAWACIEPHGATDLILNRFAILMSVLVGGILAMSLGKWSGLRNDPEWAAAMRGTSHFSLALSVGVTALILVIEIFQQIAHRHVEISMFAVGVVAAALAGGVAALLRFALVPAVDPLRLSEKGRMGYVYGAEVTVVLLLVHIRLTMPWMFHGYLSRYWPFIVMAIAFAGVILSEVFRRRKQLVLAEPLERTGVFLPLLPVIGFWAVGANGSYSTVLFAAGLLYAGLSVMRRSFGFGLVAALAGNGGLWFMLHHLDGFRFFQHPQLWLIPVALSVLVAAYSNRERLSPDTMAAVRYITLLLIYVSSSADLFINGIGSSLWLPLILGALAVAGVMAGIAFRIRACLFLGASFLLLDLLAIIWHASDNLGWTWIWYVAGIALGLTIIAVFAVFERKRSAVLEVIDKLRAWEK